MKGEDSLTGALRETVEEVGIRLSPQSGKRIDSVVGRVLNGTKFSDIVDIWLFEYDGQVDLQQASTKEVAQTVWMTKQEAKALFDNGQFVDTLGYFFQMQDL